MAIQTVRPDEVQRRARDGKPVCIVDVRTPAEYSAVHVEGAASAPLDQLSAEGVKALRGDGADKPICLMCASGQRAARAAEMLQAHGEGNILCLEGGMNAWERAGLPVVRGSRRAISLERQVRIGAGALTLAGVALGWQVHPGFYALSAFIGAGLAFSGISDWCRMALLLARMPWNRRTD